MSIICTVFGACLTLTGVPSVNDGDTITIKNHHIRIYGIDAEELGEPHGERARLALIGLVGVLPITCVSTGHTSHQRIIARCRTHTGADIGEALVRAGHALDCKKYSGGVYFRYEPAGIRAVLAQKQYC